MMTNLIATVYVSHAFKSRVYATNELRSTISNLLQKIESDINKDAARKLIVKPVFVMDAYTQRLSATIEQELKSASLGIFEISTHRPNIFFELGFLSAIGIPRVLLLAQGYKRPTDIDGRLIYEYPRNNISSISDDVRLETAIKQSLLSIRAELEQAKLKNYLKKIWFGNSPTTNINIITSSPPLNRIRTIDDDYGTQLGDQEAVSEVRTLLSKLYPTTRINIVTSTDWEKSHTQNDDENLVLIGGPGNEDGWRNLVCARIIEQVQPRVKYSPDCSALICEDKQFVAKVDGNLRLLQDWGYFARFPNPVNTQTSIVMLHGIHTYGVSGASLVFSQHPQAKVNITQLETWLGDKELGFETFFPVKVSNFPPAHGEIKPPKIIGGHFFTFLP